MARSEAQFTLPDFASLEPRIAERRATRIGDEVRARVRARRWLIAAMVAFGLIPADVLLYAWITDTAPQLQGIAPAVLLPIVMLAWAARLVTRPSFRAQVLVRSIAVSNLIVALLLALSVGGVFGAASQIIIAVSCARVLGLLGDRGLDVSEGDATFTPVAFRGFLLLALIMAFADAQTLMFSALTQGSFLFTDSRTMLIISRMVPTLLAAGVMAWNVWGLVRLRTWAMLLNIVANLVIARMALTGVLSVSVWVAGSLTLTAAVQLLLPVPILATWLGDRDAGGREWQWGARLLRACVPAAVVLTMLAAVSNLGLVRMWGWLDGNVGATTKQRGAPFSGSGGAAGLPGKGDPSVAYGPLLGPGMRFEFAAMNDCDLSNAHAPGLIVKGGSFINADFGGAKLGGAVFVGTRLTGASFRDADLEGAMLAECELDDIDWRGATCPDGFIATAETGCDAHLSHPQHVEAEALARWMGPARFACMLDRAPAHECDALDRSDSADLFARGDDLVMEWGPTDVRRELVLERDSGMSWANNDKSARIVATPTTNGHFDVFVVDQHLPDRSHWRSSWARAEQWRARLDRLHHALPWR